MAGGIFGNAKLRGGWQDLHIRPEDIRAVPAADVVALVDYAQQVSIEVVDGLAQLLATMPVPSGTAAAAVLVVVLLQRAIGGRRKAG